MATTSDRNLEATCAVARAVRKTDRPLEPLLLLISGAPLGDLDLRYDLYDDFCLSPFHPSDAPPLHTVVVSPLSDRPDLARPARRRSGWR